MNTTVNYSRTRFACYFTYIAMSAVFCLPPMLFVTFRETYGISYTLLGTLVLLNFCTQLTVDLIFTFFGKHFNIRKTLRIMPLLTSAGLLIYSVVPPLLPQYAYAGLVAGTVTFSVAAGLCEVLLSPTVAAMPSDNPGRDMSLLHSLYGYGVVSVVLLSSLYLKLFGTENWMYLTAFWAILPILCSVLFCVSPIPPMELGHKDSAPKSGARHGGMFLCVLCIFLGSAAENTMTNWISGFLETALRIPKATGDILGLALFAVALALTRSVYAKYGKNIYRVLLGSMAGAVVCYVVAGMSPVPLLSLAACMLTGMFTSMLWPGTLILMEEKFPSPGVAAYALMAAGGDFGGSIAPQGLGIVVDTVSATDWAARVGAAVSQTPEQIGLRVGMLTAAVFPIAGVLLLLYMNRYFKKGGN